tara:strand:+ start:3444 stop:3683 length:240 start_codon:yes stop_codon:yes gene_type:complete
MAKKKSKKDLILIHLQMHSTITSWEAIQKFKATRLSAIIFNLKQEGHNIITIDRYNKETGSNYAEYKLLPEDNGQIGLV